jgi:histidinol-phosphate/aromatic aminotransferase/cobyric acid decarboxylase-like protein
MEDAATVCDESVAAAREAAEEAKKAVGMVTEERAMLVAEIKKSEQVIATQTEMLNFLLQCSDLSARERSEAQAIAERMEALTREDGEDHDKA